MRVVQLKINSNVYPLKNTNSHYLLLNTTITPLCNGKISLIILWGTGHANFHFNWCFYLFKRLDSSKLLLRFPPTNKSPYPWHYLENPFYVTTWHHRHMIKHAHGQTWQVHITLIKTWSRYVMIKWKLIISYDLACFWSFLPHFTLFSFFTPL